MRKILIPLLLLLPFGAFAQFTISGRVLDKADHKPIDGATIFLSSATNSTDSKKDGTFLLTDVKAGKYSLVVSVIGYGMFSENIFINKNLKLDDILLTIESNTLKEVVIEAKKPDPFRSNYLLIFKELFIGRSVRAQDCKILNPEVLDFVYDNNQKKLTASSNGFLVIDNNALGYKIKYLLQDFVYIANADSNLLRFKGNEVYVPMSGTPAQQKRWEKARQDAYANSPIHFYRSVLSGDITENGFNVQQYAHHNNPERPTDSVITAKLTYFKKHDERDSVKYWKKIKELPKTFKELLPYSLTQDEIVSPTNVRGLYAMGCSGNGLFVTYEKNKRFPNFKIDHVNNPGNTESTLITFKDLFVYFDLNGIVQDPYSVSYQGVWQNQRLADMLPVDYDDNDLNAAPQAPVDSTIANKAIKSLQDYAEGRLVEKTYLHFDKPYYAAGDTMFFKAYLTVGPKHQLSRLSGVLHVDLINNNKVINSLKLATYNGEAWGDFVLPDSAKAGTFRVRAYTQWMRNNDEPRYFDKIIPVAVSAKNTITAGNGPRTNTAAKPDLQILPEGGSLIVDVRSKVAFKAINPNGLGTAVKGEVVDNENKTVATFNAIHLGMGYFYLQPVAGKTYKAKVTYANGMQDMVALPDAVPSGAALAADIDSTDEININISTNAGYLKAYKGKDYTLLVYSGGTVSTFIFPLDSVFKTIDINKKQLFTGITKMTLFSPTGEPIAERQVFVQNDDQLKVSVSSDKPVYAGRGKVDININAKDSDGAPVNGEFSVSVTDETKEPVDLNNEHTILNNLLLTSDLKGYVEQPNYYFISSAQGYKDLDLLMLTQGYSGFEWKNVLNNKAKKTIAYQPENTLSLSGNVKTLTGKPLADGHVTLLSTNPYIVRDTTTDANGNFTFTGLNFIDTAKLVISAVKKNNSSYVKIEINKPDYPAVKQIDDRDSTANIMTPEMMAALEKQMQQRQGNMKTGIILKEVKIKGSTESPFSPHLTHSANLNGAGMADQVILGTKLAGCNNLALCLQSLLFGVRFSGNPSNPTIYSLRTPIELVGNTKSMVIIVDGVIHPQEILGTLSESDVYSIEVLLKPFYLAIYGEAASGGAIVITTKRGGDANYTPTAQPGSVNYRFAGYYRARTFYSPKYEASAPVRVPDARTTIFWEPDVVTDKDGKASLEFYNADGPGTYRVVIEGIDGSGNLGRQVYHYVVK